MNIRRNGSSHLALGRSLVEQRAKFELVINGKTAKALRLFIPQSILISVNKVLEQDCQLSAAPGRTGNTRGETINVGAVPRGRTSRCRTSGS